MDKHGSTFINPEADIKSVEYVNHTRFGQNVTFVFCFTYFFMQIRINGFRSAYCHAFLILYS